MLKRLAGKAIEALPAVVGSVAGAILSFLEKTVGFIAEHTWALIVFVAGLVGWWLMQKFRPLPVLICQCTLTEVDSKLMMIDRVADGFVT